MLLLFPARQVDSDLLFSPVEFSPEILFAARPTKHQQVEPNNPTQGLKRDTASMATSLQFPLRSSWRVIDAPAIKSPGVDMPPDALAAAKNLH